MKIHLPIVLRKALMAVFAVGVTAALATTSAMAAENVTIIDDTTYDAGLTMDGTVSNKIAPSSSFGIILGSSPDVTVTSGNMAMTSVKGYNAIVGSMTFQSSIVKVEDGSILMDGPANVVMLGSSVTGNQITMQNSGKQSIAVGTVAGGILGDFAAQYVPSQLREIEGSFNVVQGSIVGDINTTQTVSMDSATANMIVGGLGTGMDVDFGSSVNAKGNINLTGGANVVVDTTMANLAAFATSSPKDLTKLLQGSKGTSTTLTAGNNINMGAKMNLVHGGQSVVLTAGNAVNLTGAVNVLAGKTSVNAVDINLTPTQKTYITTAELATLLPEKYVTLAETTGIADKLAKGVNASVVAGGAELTATNNITTSGTVSAFVNTPTEDVVSALQALKNATASNPVSELQLATDLLGKGMATTIKAGNNIEMGSRLNLLHGGNSGDASQALLLEAGKSVDLKGTFNVVSGNVVVNADNINLLGTSKIALNWDSVIPAEYASLVNGSGVTDKLSSGVQANVVTGGATLNAKTDITLNSMANMVLDTEASDVTEAVRTGKTDSLMEGGAYDTTLTAGNNINLKGRLNVVNGGQVALNAGNAVNVEGTLNVISGNSVVNGKDINLVGKQNVGLDWGALLPDKYAAYGELAKQMGIIDKMNSGVNGSVIAGGAELYAKNDITTSGMATAVVDATLGNVLETLQNKNLGPMVQGGTDTTTLTADNNINLQSRLNLVSGGKVALKAGNAVNMTGTFNVLNGNTTVNAKDINLTAKNKVGVNIAPMLTGHYAELAEEMGMTDILKNGVSSNIVAGGAKLTAENDIVMSGVASAVVDTTLSNVVAAVKNNDLGKLMQGGDAVTTVTAKHDIKLESQMNVVNGGNAGKGGVILDAGNDVSLGGQISVVNRANVTAGQNVNLQSGLSVVKNADITAEEGNIAFSGAETRLNNAKLTADKGAVTFTNTSAEMTNGSISATGVTLSNSVLVNTANSKVSLDCVVTVTDKASIENYGTLTLKDAVVTNATLYSDSANTTISGALTLQAATLVYTTDSLTLNTTGIDLSIAGDALNINTPAGARGVDAVAGVNFLLSSELLSGTDGEFALILFENATQNDFDKMFAAIQANEVSITLSDLNSAAIVTDVLVGYEDGNIVVTGNASIPEPTTATLSLLALAALAARRRRK